MPRFVFGRADLHAPRLRFQHPGPLRENRFDFTELDTEAANLDLKVDPSETLDVAIRPITRQVTGLVQPRAGRSENG